MKICTIIAEFNPLHNGHKRLIDYAKTKGDVVCCIISGNFTQRGLPAVADKYTRARHAILAGADIVLELPTIYATASAENFAYGAVQIAKAINSATLCFGSECGDTELLTKCANELINAKENQNVKDNLQKGYSYPLAIAQAFPAYSEILSHPNNVLAIEYIKAIESFNADIAICTLARPDNHNNADINAPYVSSKAIREALDLNLKIDALVPQYVIESVNNQAEAAYKSFVPKAISTFEAEYLKDIEGVTEGIENRIINCNYIGDYDQLVSAIKTKRYTQLKIQRILFNTVMNITKEIVVSTKSANPQITVLAVRDGKRNLMSITSPQSKTESDAVAVDKRANRLYSSLIGKHIKNKLLVLR